MTGVAIVTGAAGGIGSACCRRLAECGYNIVVNYATNAKGAIDLVSACQKKGVETRMQQGDIASDDNCQAIAECALDAWGRIDVLINNAGVTRFADADDLDGLSAQDFDTVFATNVTGSYQMVRACRDALTSSDEGSVVNISSHSGFSGMGSSIAYAASKGALNTLTLGLARALAPAIRVNAVCPGFVDTQWLAPTLTAAELEAFRERVVKVSPLNYLVSTDDVAEAVCWFVLGGHGITGQLLVIDGGTHLSIANPINTSS